MVRTHSLPLGILASAVAIVVATYFALTIELFGWDVDITRWAQGYELGPARFLKEWLFWMGVKGVAGATMVLVAIIFWARRLRVEAVFLVLIGLTDMAHLWLRDVIARPRPTADLVDVVGGPQGFSFPSGTAAHTLLFYGFLIYLADRALPSRRWANALWAAGFAYLVVTALWLIYDGRHWFTDIMGGYLYGAFYLLVIIAGYRWAKARALQGRRAAPSSGVLRLVRKPFDYVLQAPR